MNHRAVLALSSLVITPSLFADYADTVVSFTSGNNAVASLNQAASVLGEPTRDIPGDYGGPVTPFNAPYLSSELFSIGAGGSLTVSFSSPVQNAGNNPYNLDFIIFGNTMFYDSAWPSGITDGDGTTFGENIGSTLVSVSSDGNTFFRLNPALAPTVDNLFPTDGAGDFSIPVDPSLQKCCFANLTLEQIRALYAKSGGGTGYDISWAQDGNGQSVHLDSIRYVRIDVLSGRAEIDAFSSVAVPEPSTLAMLFTGLGLGLTQYRRWRKNTIR